MSPVGRLPAVSSCGYRTQAHIGSLSWYPTCNRWRQLPQPQQQPQQRSWGPREAWRLARLGHRPHAGNSMRDIGDDLVEIKDDLIERISATLNGGKGRGPSSKQQQQQGDGSGSSSGGGGGSGGGNGSDNGQAPPKRPSAWTEWSGAGGPTFFASGVIACGQEVYPPWLGGWTVSKGLGGEAAA